MKKFNFLRTCIASFAILVGMGSCSDDNNLPEDQTKNIVEIVSDDSNFSLLRAAVIRADLVETLAGSGNFTVFAPNNDAFIAAGFESESSINSADPDMLKTVLMYHVLTSRTSSTNIPNAVNTIVQTAADKNIFVSKIDGNVSINGARVMQADVMAKNGIIHVIDKVLMPAMGDIIDVAQDDDNLSFLVAAVLRASEGSINIAEMLQGDGPYTVFAPVNQAFIDVGFASEDAIKAASTEMLTEILTTHVLTSRVYSTALTEGMTAATIAENNLTFALNGGAKVSGPGNDEEANIINPDVTVDNGVIHVIDSVLLP